MLNHEKEYYIICKTTHYGRYHTPIWVEVDYHEAKKIGNQLQKLYDKKAASGKPNMFTRDVASIFKVSVPENWNSDMETMICQRKPMYCETDLVGYIGLFREHHETDMKMFLLDIEKELAEAEAAASAADDGNDYDEYI